ncbi:unnamed protein product [Closterium sp. Yama58-4]|nr:unnamed protein product [Closterium sp. Yama58-4]
MFELELAGCDRVMSAGMAHVGKITTLKQVDLRRSGVLNDGLQHLTYLVKLEELFFLWEVHQPFPPRDATFGGLSTISGDALPCAGLEWEQLEMGAGAGEEDEYGVGDTSCWRGGGGRGFKGRREKWREMRNGGKERWENVRVRARRVMNKEMEAWQGEDHVAGRE